MNPLKTALVVFCLACLTPSHAGMPEVFRALERNDYARAAVEVTPLALRSHPEAQFILSDLYRRGLGVPRDTDKANAWLEKAVWQHERHALFALDLVKLAQKGYPGKLSGPMGHEGDSALSELSDPETQTKLGLRYLAGSDAPEDHRQALVWLLKAAHQGDGDAQYALGIMHELGWGTPKNNTQAAKWYLKATNAKAITIATQLLATEALGIMYLEGRGVPQDDDTAVSWLSAKPYNGRKIWADFQLGLLHSTGRGVEKDDERAFTYFNAAAQSHIAEAEFILGGAYAVGHATKVSISDSIYWYKRAADQGHDEAQLMLGLTYMAGRGVPKSEKEASAWFKKAAASGNAKAQYLLGISCKNGLGMQKDAACAFAWLSLAAQQGYAAAGEELPRLAATLSPQAKTQAKTFVASWTPGAALNDGDSPGPLSTAKHQDSGSR